jgi:hypothetical protein
MAQCCFAPAETPRDSGTEQIHPRPLQGPRDPLLGSNIQPLWPWLLSLVSSLRTLV